ncbi:hypothetical protein JCM30471_34730 [Desulfuromonas carbonis]|uniref:DUF58 domain-containing protein n=1 Tax=Desulfuromonas sp. DDH964 TaxID=1823759 RepID=UPI00078C975D|nr:DUF58 domain-containing protein [Desulfuromonas sp. DDH964]AMV72836.1 hypothetical protein DBW_2506 [Desulfuromonas sp. DDH964]
MTTPADLRALVRRLELHSRRLLDTPLAGDYRSRMRGRGMEFAALRPYEAGDDPRAIDPFASARSGRLHVRLQQEERAREIVLLADLSQSCTPAKRELLTETVALLGAVAVNHRDRVGLIAFSDRIELLVPASGGWPHLRRLLAELLACRPAGSGTDLALPFATAARLQRRSSLCFVLSDFHAPWPATAIDRCHLRHDLLALVLRDPRERDWPAGGILRVGDAEAGRHGLLDLHSRQRRGIVTAWQECDRTLAARFSQRAIDHVFLQSGTPPLAALRELFQRRRRT